MKVHHNSGSGTLGFIQAIRELDYMGSVTVISREPNLIIDRTKLSKALITDANKLLWRPKEWYDSASIETVSDEVTSVDFGKKSVSTKSGKQFPYTKLVLATGGVPKAMPVEGIKELGNIFLLRFVTDAQNIVKAVEGGRKKVVVVGSSFIGMEVGNKLSSDHDVTIVGMEKAPMQSIMGEEVGRIFQKNLEKNGVTFKLNNTVTKATPSQSDPSKVGAIHLKDNTVLPADVVILGIGVRPATDFLKNSPLPLEPDGSVRTNENFAVPGFNNDVFAIGDIAKYPYHGPGADPARGTPVRIEHWNVAQNSGRGAAHSIAHNLSNPPGDQSLGVAKAFIPVFWSALGAQLRYCGHTPSGYDKVVFQGDPGNAKFAAFYCKGEAVVAVATMGMDPVMSKSAELMRRGNMATRSQVENGVDVLGIDVPGSVVI